MRRIVRGLLWLIKGMLLAIALAAMILWPWSYGHDGLVGLSRYSQTSERVESLVYAVAYCDGRIAIGCERDIFRDDQLSDAHDEAASHGPGWKREVGSGKAWLDERNSWTHQGPLWFWFNQGGGRGITFQWRVVAVPFWLLFLSTAPWPLTSLTLLIRRRSRRRRLARAGCCAKCGYDLRSVPEKGGALLERCPECGMVMVGIGLSAMGSQPKEP